MTFQNAFQDVFPNDFSYYLFCNIQSVLKAIRTFEKLFQVISCTFWGTMIALSACSNPTNVKIQSTKTPVDTSTISQNAAEVSLEFVNAYVANCNQLKNTEEIVAWVIKNTFYQ